MRLIFLGAPGAGKGTQGEALAKAQNIPHISTGDILRQAVAEGTPLGLLAKSYMDEGELVPDSLIMGLIEGRLEQADAQKGWILDGFPRNLDQAQALNELLQKMKQNYDRVVYFMVSQKILIDRMLERGRKDDNEATVRRRLEVYRERTAPLIQFYRDIDSLEVIDGNADVATVSNSLRQLLEQWLGQN
ncbi:MAG: adenylate kinase [Pleurocapsa sp. MO_192.B19]|nr:adenylate kinase [Pleurocapsa sp. MO_192.B19]